MKNERVESMFATPFFHGQIDYEYNLQEDVEWVDGHNREDVILPNVTILNEPELEEKILECADYLIHAVGFVKQPMKVNQMWLNIYDSTRIHLPVHFHQNCSWSGTFFPVDGNHTTWYLNPNAGYQNAYLPEHRKNEDGEKLYSDFNSDFIPFTNMPKGSVIIHPPWIGHSVTWNSGRPSLSISFDIAYKGEIGSKQYGSYNDGQ